MRLLAYTKQRLEAFVAEIDNLRGSDIPYPHSRAALDELRRLFSDELVELQALSPDADSGNLDVLRRGGSASVDLRLGTWFMSLKQARTSSLRIQDQAVGASIAKTHYVPFGTPFVLHPMTFVLAATLEWIRLPRSLAAYVVGKSSWGPLWVDHRHGDRGPSVIRGCITLELSNVGEIPIEVKPGYPICQLFFHTFDGIPPETFVQGNFGGSRRPIFRPIQLDTFAEKLARSDTK